jgi:UDP-2,3-diacylglucosamine pyrophosphatase LpxH
VRVVPEEVELKTRDHRVYIAHGDLVDREDHGYLALRTLFRSPITRFAAFALPARAVEWIGNTFSASSRQKNPRLPEERGGDRLAELRKIYRGFAREKFEAGYRAVILGHCHDLDGAEFKADGRVGQYLNVGFPRKHHQYVVFTDEAGLTRKLLPGFEA